MRFPKVAAAVVVAMLAFPVQGLAADPTMTAPVPPGKESGPPVGKGEPAPAPEALLSREEALAILQKWFGVTEAKLNLHRSEGRDPAVWYFSYTTQPGGRLQSGGMDANTGRILMLDQWGGGYDQPVRTGPAKEGPSRTDAWFKAWDLVQAMYPELVGRVKTVPAGMDPTGMWGYGGDVWRFSWVEHVDGVPVPDSYVQVALDKESLAYVGLHYSVRDGASFPYREEAVPAAQAMEQLHTLLQPNLSYQPVYDRQSSRIQGMALVYQLAGLYPGVNAVTGEVLTYPYEPAAVKEVRPVPAGDPSLIRKPSSLPVTAEGAKAMVAPLLEFLSAETEVYASEVYSGYDKYDGYGESGRISIRFDSMAERSGGHISVNPRTGRVTEAFRWGPFKESKVPPAFTEQDHTAATDAAITLVQQFYGDLTGDLRLNVIPLVDWWGPGTARYFFQRYLGDIPVSGDGIGVSIDLETKRWTELTFNWTEGVSFPDAKKAISAEEALAQFMEGRSVHLVWEFRHEGGPDFRYDKGYGFPAGKATLVYRLSHRVDRPEAAYIDALTRHELDYDGRRILRPEELDQKLKGHWAERQLRYLVGLGVIDLDRLSPNDTLTMAEAIRILEGAGWYPKPDYYGPGLGISEVKESSTEPVTRLAVAQWAAARLGLERLAGSDLKAETSFKDLGGLSQAERNSVILLEALGVVRSSTQFRPHDPLTVAEAATFAVHLRNELLRRTNW